jgi:hypothetical protein
MDNVSLRYFETQPRAITKQLRWYDTLAFMDIKLIHKPSKDNVVPSRKKEYQGEMPLESTQILLAMLVRENDLKIKI